MPAKQDAIGRRIGAAAIDIALVWIAFIVVLFIFGEKRGGSGAHTVWRFKDNSGYVLFGLLVFAYYWRTELAWGATLGKRWLGLHVVSEDGTPPTPRAILMRNLLRIVDGLPAFYLLGFVVAMSNERRQRVGDLVAHTTVVPKTTAPPPPEPEQGPSDEEVLAQVLGR
jgi:uncharacterized RDD family membrane protein YckC